jgi:1,4-dihydroxy-6-naphthoate synthase
MPCPYSILLCKETGMHQLKRLRIAHTPESDDAFYYDALLTGQVCLSDFKIEFHRRPVSVLNRDAASGLYEVTAISSVIYPLIAHRYAILSVGTSVGRGYGPVLVSREPRKLEQLRGKRVGVPGIPTTGWLLLHWLCPEAVPMEMPHDHIAEAVVAGHIEAGVMIHEELLYYPQLGVRRVIDLGAEWCRRHELPLPVGLNVIRRDLGQETMELICTGLRRSVRHSLNYPDEALTRVRRFGRAVDGECTRQFVAMFANEDSEWMPPDVRTGLQVLFEQLVELGLCDLAPALDIIEGTWPIRLPETVAAESAVCPDSP